MSPKPFMVDESPCSAFVQEMRAAFLRRLAAATDGEKAGVDREIAGIMRAYLGRSSWEAMVDAERRPPVVPRGTTSDRSCHRHSRYRGGADRKLLAAGRDDE